MRASLHSFTVNTEAKKSPLCPQFWLHLLWETLALALQILWHPSSP